ncbi:hypothetical protein [Mesotoga sp.]|uniref:hypothetical protein n=1 Tax=Mesotoga sp. TaxID=2053577 RepID=UPI001BD28288|nr:hypothetical protein [Mesotoga sp.]
MKRSIPLLAIIIISSCLCSTTFYFGMGFGGLVEVSLNYYEWKVRILPVPSLSSGGVFAGGLIFNVLRDRGFAVLPANQQEKLSVVDTFHCEAIDVDVERLEVFVADGTLGLKVFKFYGPLFYRHVQTIPLKGWTNSVSYCNDYVLVGSELDGLFVVRRGDSGFELIDQIHPRYINDLESGLTINAVAVSKGAFYVAAANKGVLIFEIGTFGLEERQGIPVGYAMDVAVLDGEVFVVDSLGSRILIYDESDHTLKENLEVERPLRELVPIFDWWQGRKLLLCRFDDSVSVIDKETFQEVFSLKGSFFGIIEPRYLFGYPFREE